MSARKPFIPDTGCEATPPARSVSQRLAAGVRRQLYRLVATGGGIGAPLRYLKSVADLGQLHLKSRHMKLKVHMLGRRYLALRAECEQLERMQAGHPVEQPPATPAAIAASRHGPIWLHGSWRTGSTYVWHKFRADPRYLAYYEPFHERLEQMSIKDAETARHDSWNSHHPNIGAPYFEEYKGFIEGAGVAGFAPAFSYRNFFVNEDPLRDQRAYLDALIGWADRQGRRPVFGFCRSWGRAAWFRRHAAPGVHIALTRDPLSLWRSVLQRHERYGDTYFLIMPLVTLMLSRREPWLARYLRALHLDEIEPAVDFGCAQRTAQSLLKTDPPRIMHAFAAAQGLGMTIALRHADLIVPIEDLACAMRRRTLHDTLRGRYDIDLDWSDCQIPVTEPRTEDRAFLGAWTQARTEAEKVLDSHPFLASPAA